MTERDYKQVLITGAGGMLGTYADFGTRLGRVDLNVVSLTEVRHAFDEIKPVTVLHLAAATDIVASEKNPEGTYMINAVGTYNVALAAKERGIRVVFISTSAVFDGSKSEPYTESDQPRPNSHYGNSKYLGELALHGLMDDYAIVRTCWLFGGGPEKDHKFVANILRQTNQPEIQVIGGKHGSPTYCKDLLEAVREIAFESGQTIYHIGNAGAPTRADIAREIVSITGSRSRVVEVDGAAFESKYPGAGARGNESIRSEFMTLRPWQQALREYIVTEWSGYILNNKK